MKDHGMGVGRTACRVVDAQGKAGCSHYSYAGGALGKLTVPQGAATAELARAIVQDAAMGRYACLTENKPPERPMRFYLDIDRCSALEPTMRWWTDLERVIIAEIRRFYPDADPGIFQALVLASGVHDVVAADGTRAFKAGVHMVFQNLFVDIDQALYLSSAILARAEHEWPDAPGAWAKTIDQAVYGASRGLRWAWQFKAKKCEACGGKGKARPEGVRLRPTACGMCITGSATDFQSSMYAPVYYVDAECHRRLVPPCRYAPTVDLLLDSSIRYVERELVTAGFTAYPGAPRPPQLHLVNKTQNVVTVETVADREARRSVGSAILLERGDPLIGVIEGAVRRVHPMYASVDLAHVVRAGNGLWYRALAKNVGAGYCMNVGRDHSHATVKFLIKPSGVVQTCFSNKVCKQFVSKPAVPLLLAERAQLFPGRGAATDHAQYASAQHARAGNGGGSGSGTERQCRTISETLETAARDLQHLVTTTPVPAAIADLSFGERMKGVTSVRLAGLAAWQSKSPVTPSTASLFAVPPSRKRPYS